MDLVKTRPIRVSISGEVNRPGIYSIDIKGVNNLATEQIEDLIDAVIYECDKYFPAFQLFVHKKNDPEYVLKTVLLETLGEA